VTAWRRGLAAVLGAAGLWAAGVWATTLWAGTARAEGVPPGSDVGAWSDRWVGDPRLRYDRVDGALVGGRLTFQREGARETVASGELAYATARRKGVYRLELRQSLRADNRLHLDGDFHRLTRPFEYDGEIVGDMENTLAAFFFRNDYATGTRAAPARPCAGVAPGLGLALSAPRGMRALTRRSGSSQPVSREPTASVGCRTPSGSMRASIRVGWTPWRCCSSTRRASGAALCG
jgi:hypothetical protein